MSEPFVIIGDGWSALGAVGFALESGREVVWVAGTGARMAAPLPTLDAGDDWKGDLAWSQLASAFGVDAGAAQAGSYLREYRSGSKGFRKPAWSKAATPENRLSVREEELAPAERTLAPNFETRFALDVNELERQIRDRILAEDASHARRLRRLEGVPVVAIHADHRHVTSVKLGNGEEIRTQDVIYADRWSDAHSIEGLPKGIAFLRKRHPVGVLQTIFAHEPAVGAGLQEGFFGALNREAGEAQERHVWGYFAPDGRKSFWTVCMTHEEGEDNHLVAKRLRRLKGALDKMFSGETWLPEGKQEFMQTVASEQVRFEESVLFTDGESPRAPEPIKSMHGLFFVTDGYGASAALHQVASHFGKLVAPETLVPVESSSSEPGAEQGGTEREAENSDRAEPFAN